MCGFTKAVSRKINLISRESHRYHILQPQRLHFYISSQKTKKKIYHAEKSSQAKLYTCYCYLDNYRTTGSRKFSSIPAATSRAPSHLKAIENKRTQKTDASGGTETINTQIWNTTSPSWSTKQAEVQHDQKTASHHW